MANDFLIRECDQWLSKCGNLRDSEFNSRLSRRTGKHSRPNRQGQTIYDVKTDQIEAAFDNGFVTITIPKTTQHERVIRVPIAGVASRPALGAQGETEGVKDTRSNSHKQLVGAGSN